ncbi:MAG: ATP-binding protein [Terracidiphilus sp.]|jgi:signal transduction histidine kinase/DNA-binding response OmpR family regulator
MNEALPIFTVRLRQERHVVQARQRAREIAALLGFEHQEQIRLATATSELARNAFRYAADGAVEFLVRDGQPQLFEILVTDSGPGIANLSDILDGRYVSRTGLGKGIIGTRRLMDHFDISSSASGTRVLVGKGLPVTASRFDMARAKNIAVELVRSGAADPFDEMERQNQELLRTLAELREKQDQLAEMNQELEDTNRGVVALYAELDQNADDLRRVSGLKSSFMSNLSHEFRTPLNSIASLCQLLLTRSDGELSTDQEKQVTYIRKSAEELTELVNDLLDLAKVESGKIDVKPKHFEVQDLFGALRAMLRPLLTGNSLELIFNADPELPILFTDQGKVSQILRNLISNALKFTRRGHVRLSAQTDGLGYIVFSVEDTGIGIAPDDQHRVFDEFVQIESELQAKVKGTGLGLPLSKRLAELLGGSISLKSELGVGSTFQVTIPIHLGQFVPEQVSQEHSPDKSGPTVLFIEDNPETSFVHEASLKSSSYNLRFARNIPEARAMMRTYPPDVVSLDRYIDGQDELIFIQELKESGFKGPILVISVIDESGPALSAGADSFLAKPVTPFKLTSTLHMLLEGRLVQTILLADDDEVSRYLMGEALSKLGFNIVEAQNGRDALSMIKSHSLNGIFLDLAMPDLTGFEVLRELNRDPVRISTPIIVHSSKDLSAQETNALEGMGAFIFPKRELSSEFGSEKLREMLKVAGIGK